MALDTPELIDRTKALLVQAFGRPRPHREVARVLNLTPERVRQIERRALRHLGERLRATLER